MLSTIYLFVQRIHWLVRPRCWPRRVNSPTWKSALRRVERTVSKMKTPLRYIANPRVPWSSAPILSRTTICDADRSMNCPGFIGFLSQRSTVSVFEAQLGIIVSFLVFLYWSLSFYVAYLRRSMFSPQHIHLAVLWNVPFHWRHSSNSWRTIPQGIINKLMNEIIISHILPPTKTPLYFAFVNCWLHTDLR